MRRHPDPIQQRRIQIEREISKLQSLKHRKRKADFKTEAAFDHWTKTCAEKLEELYEQTAILDFPDSYNEVPLAIMAAELGVSLSEVQWIVAEGFVELSYVGHFPASSRISRDELARVIDVGRDELLRRARMEIPEMFVEALELLTARDLDGAKKVYDRIEKHDSCINPFALAIEIGIRFLEDNVVDLQENVAFILRRNYDDLVPSLAAVRSMFTALPKGSHLAESIRERVLAIADGTCETPFRNTFDSYKGTRFPSQLDENQNLAIYIGDVVLDSIQRYKLLKSFYSSRSYLSEIKAEEMERVVQNAIYTALEARRTYSDSPSSKLYVDQFVGSKTARRKPPELIELLPKCHQKSAKAG